MSAINIVWVWYQIHLMPLPVSSEMTIKFILCFPEIIIYSKAMSAHVAQCNYWWRSLDRWFIGHVIDEHSKWILNEWRMIRFDSLLFWCTMFDSIRLILYFLKKTNTCGVFCTAHNCVNNMSIIPRILSDKFPYFIKLNRVGLWIQKREWICFI